MKFVGQNTQENQQIIPHDQNNTNSDDREPEQPRRSERLR